MSCGIRCGFLFENPGLLECPANIIESTAQPDVQTPELTGRKRHVTVYGDALMNRKELESFIPENYSADADYPWPDRPAYEVFRHNGNRKWFALIMDIPGNKLGLQECETLDIVNLKCNPILISSLMSEAGFFPAYHMNKEHWITVALDGSAPDDKIKMLVDMSYRATAPKLSKEKRSNSF